MGKFETGHKKVGGKTVGSKNEKTKQWEELAEAIVMRHTERFNRLLDDLEDKDFKSAYLEALEYFKPKLQRTTIVGDATQPINVNFTPIGKNSTGK